MNAQEYGAQLLIIMDDKEEQRKIIPVRDKTGMHISIATIMINKITSDIIENYLKSNSSGILTYMKF